MTEALNHLPYEIIPVTENITLRQMQLSDTDTLFSLVDNDRTHLGRWLPWVAVTKQPEDTADFIRTTLEKRANGSAYEYGIVCSESVVGHISLMHVTDGQPPEIGYWVASKVAGQGITSAAANAITRFGLDTLGLSRIVIKAEPDNIASNKVAEKLGYTLDTTEYDKNVSHTVNIWAIENSAN